MSGSVRGALGDGCPYRECGSQRDPGGRPAVPIETRISPPEERLSEVRRDQLLLAKELDHSAAQVPGHPSQVAERDKDEAARLIETTFENERMKVRIEPGLRKTGRPLLRPF